MADSFPTIDRAALQLELRRRAASTNTALISAHRRLGGQLRVDRARDDGAGHDHTDEDAAEYRRCKNQVDRSHNGDPTTGRALD